MKRTQHDCAEELKQVGLQVTPARIAALQLFESHDDLLDAEHIGSHLEKDPGIDRATTFRTLNTLTEKGVLIKVDLGDGKSRYELASKTHHHHLICENCGKIEDITGTILAPQIEEKIKKNNKFLIKRHSVEFFGLCKECQKKLQKSV